MRISRSIQPQLRSPAPPVPQRQNEGKRPIPDGGDPYRLPRRQSASLPQTTLSNLLGKAGVKFCKLVSQSLHASLILRRADAARLNSLIRSSSNCSCPSPAGVNL